MNIFLKNVLHFNYKYFENIGNGSTVKGINDLDLKSLTFISPPLKEQQKIATILSDMDQEIEQLELRIAKAKQVKAGMMQQLLTGKIRLVQPQPVQVTK